jgi:uncharacterized YccA/Bax inhibitor family protein
MYASKDRTLIISLALALLMLLSAAGLWLALYPLTDAGTGSAARVRDVALVAGVLAFAGTGALSFQPRWSVYAAPVIALSAGLFAGGLSLHAELRMPGIAIQAVLITFAVFVLLFGGYRTGLIPVGRKVRAVAMSAMAAIALVYLGSFLLILAGYSLAFISGNGWGAKLWSLFIAVVAALNLLVDLAIIDSIDARRWPRHMEWYIATGTLVTFVWLYISVLRVLRR